MEQTEQWKTLRKMNYSKMYCTLLVVGSEMNDDPIEYFINLQKMGLNKFSNLEHLEKKDEIYVELFREFGARIKPYMSSAEEIRKNIDKILVYVNEYIEDLEKVEKYLLIMKD